jgi:hypothetical protein
MTTVLSLRMFSQAFVELSVPSRSTKTRRWPLLVAHVLL